MIVQSGVVACTCNSAVLEAEFGNDLGSDWLGATVLQWVGEFCLNLNQAKERHLIKYWDLAETYQGMKIPSWAKLATAKKSDS